jgi:hypothetical protein
MVLFRMGSTYACQSVVGRGPSLQPGHLQSWSSRPPAKLVVTVKPAARAGLAISVVVEGEWVEGSGGHQSTGDASASPGTGGGA